MAGSASRIEGGVSGESLYKALATPLGIGGEVIIPPSAQGKTASAKIIERQPDGVAAWEIKVEGAEPFVTQVGEAAVDFILDEYAK